VHQSAYALANHWVAKVALLCSTFCMSSPTISHASNTVVNLVAQVSQMVADRPTGNTPKTSNRQKPYQKAKAIAALEQNMKCNCSIRPKPRSYRLHDITQE